MYTEKPRPPSSSNTSRALKIMIERRARPTALRIAGSIFMSI